MPKEKKETNESKVEQERVPEFDHSTEHPDGTNIRLASDETQNANTMYEQY